MTESKAALTAQAFEPISQHPDISRRVFEALVGVGFIIAEPCAGGYKMRGPTDEERDATGLPHGILTDEQIADYVIAHEAKQARI